jgi:hypothetical protein
MNKHHLPNQTVLVEWWQVLFYGLEVHYIIFQKLLKYSVLAVVLILEQEFKKEEIIDFCQLSFISLVVHWCHTIIFGFKK